MELKETVRVHSQGKPPNLGLDFDGVIADTAAAFIRIACEEYNYCGITIADIQQFPI
jgi:hypothetical protein